MNNTIELQILLPVHNEAESIESTIKEIYDELSKKVSIEFLICEDGSVDDTKNVLRRISKIYPLKLIMSDERKGYSRAVMDGMLAMEAPYLLCVDSDGQCDPKDFWAFWTNREKYDVLIGWRVKRADTFMRRAFSRFFYLFYELIFHVPVHDPSCPFILAKRQVIARLVNELGEMKQGFWWEFVARTYRRGFSIKEIPVNHRLRSAGTTQVYKINKMPGIFMRHFIALFKIWSQTRK
jgi:glycosyltransferase involved in cell wall biosynthesis